MKEDDLAYIASHVEIHIHIFSVTLNSGSCSINFTQYGTSPLYKMRILMTLLFLPHTPLLPPKSCT